MFEYLEPSDHDESEVAQGTGSLPLSQGTGGNSPGAGSLPFPPRSGPNDKETRSLNPEKVRHLLYGSLPALDRTIKILHAQGYADPNDWSDPIPVPPSSTEPRPSSSVQTWMVILTKTLLLE